MHVSHMEEIKNILQNFGTDTIFTVEENVWET
jgi:hypothetical protein